MKKIYETQGTCAKAIALDVDETTGIINEIQFLGGCQGNTTGVAALVRGQKAEDVINRLEGIRCGIKNTSCPDQLARALREVMGM
ncbi:MAG: TIGR03905 family TSCPD domain-containing protein [Prevotellaceae bacterium]|nr:TIGR03905 family TSCPD domain-containing protein [Candidatus Minthosoma caballi]